MSASTYFDKMGANPSVQLPFSPICQSFGYLCIPPWDSKDESKGTDCDCIEGLIYWGTIYNKYLTDTVQYIQYYNDCSLFNTLV